MRIIAAITLIAACGIQAQEREEGILRGLPSKLLQQASQSEAAAKVLLEPFLQDLALSPTAGNQSYLEKKYQEIAALGPTVRPALLQMLTPRMVSGETLAMAQNAASVIALMHPEQCIEYLIRLVDGDQPEARRQALVLLGLTDDLRAVACIHRNFDELRGDPLLRALESLRQLGSPAVAMAAARHLGSQDHQLRVATLRYLTASRAKEALNATLVAFTPNSSTRILPLFLSYFLACGNGQARVADELLPLLNTTRLQQSDQLRLIQGLAKLAPLGHEPTLSALQTIVDSGGISTMHRESAKTLEQLGSDDGKRKLFRNLDRDVRRNSKSSTAYLQRAEAYFLFEEWRSAARDFNQAIRFVRGLTNRQTIQLRLARAEARRGNERAAVDALRESGLKIQGMQRELAQDPFLARAMESKRGQALLRELSGS